MGGPGVSGVRSRCRPYAQGRGLRLLRAPLPHGAVQQTRRPALPSVRNARQLRPALGPRPPVDPAPFRSRPRPAARPFRCGSGVSGRRRRHKLPRWRRAGGCERRSGRAGRGAEPGRRRADGAGAGGASRAPRTRGRGQGRPAGGRSAAADAHEVRGGRGQRGTQAGAAGGRAPGERGVGGRAPAGPGRGRTRDPPARRSLPRLCGPGARRGAGGGGPWAQSPGAAPGRGAGLWSGGRRASRRRLFVPFH